MCTRVEWKGSEQICPLYKMNYECTESCTYLSSLYLQLQAQTLIISASA